MNEGIKKKQEAIKKREDAENKKNADAEAKHLKH